MTVSARPDLLQPSLDGSSRLAVAPYSQQTGMWSAFFGGPLAAIAMIGINAWRVGRWRRDAVWLVLLLGAYLAWIWFLFRTPKGVELGALMVSLLGSRAISYCDRLIALLIFLGGLLLHRAEQRSADLFGLKRPNGWLMGLLLIVGGFFAAVLLVVGVGVMT